MIPHRRLSFAHAVDLVKFIRQEHGDYFGIAVAGYPETHLECKSPDLDIKYLKEKVEAGADLVISQLFYDVPKFLEWVGKCRKAGITVPILPGIMPIQNYNGFRRVTSFSKTSVPQHIWDTLEPIKEDDSRVKTYGIELGAKMCKELLDGGVMGLHFYTLNLERSVTKILEKLQFVSLHRDGGLPWKQSPLSTRQSEDVRPIFWANRPDSYLDRTQVWDEFPNGRWGDASSPAFGDLTDYHLCSFKTGPVKYRRKLWGKEPKSEQEIYEVFASYLEGKTPRLPWCESSVHLETKPLKTKLLQLNRAGYLTINSQPAVNGASSSDPAVGWGQKNGYVYQKAYLEFFCSRAHLDKFIAAIDKNEKLSTNLSYTAVNCRGETLTNRSDQASPVCAVTWGIFPDAEVIQPTVVDSRIFTSVWKDEAFALWESQWQSIYEPNSPSYNLIKSIHDKYFLVNLVDHEYIKGDIFTVFQDLKVIS
eukprot:g49019.t1